MTALAGQPVTAFTLPEELTATEPAEHRGLARDGIRLLVAEPGSVRHTKFARLDELLNPGDLVVVNTSRTLAAQVDGVRAGNQAVVIHIATELDDQSWVLELRTAPDARRPVLTAQPGEVIRLPDGLDVRLLRTYPDSPHPPTDHSSRLWRASVATPTPLAGYLARHGRPISYGYLHQRWPLEDYQTIFGIQPGSAEMPSAGRPFTPGLVTRLVASGVGIAPIVLHTGLSSQEADEPPQAERFSVPGATARQVNATRLAGGRIVAVGTTVTRALESAARADGTLEAVSGWTGLVLGPDRPVRVVNGLITGLHDPKASHLLLVEAIAGTELTQRCYDAAITERYLWHEFGDSCLLLP
jgi:S-adenosylmethionine:tRNA ribosyltransferase-isomerase